MSLGGERCGCAMCAALSDAEYARRFADSTKLIVDLASHRHGDLLIRSFEAE